MTTQPRLKSETMTPAEKLAWLRLSRTENVGPITFHRLVERYGSATRALEALPDLARRGGRKNPLKAPAPAQTEGEYEALRKIGGDIITAHENSYPSALAATDDAPPVISILGNPDLMAKSCIAMVGARNASANGCMFAKKLASDMGAAGYVVASGLARGIDAAAHRGALGTGTIAVIGGGINNVYPPENAILFEEIAATGLIISELPFGAEPHARSFPGRNRIIAGMSRGVVVVEASLKSGSLITADYANDYGRDVFAVPGSPMDPRCHGTNKLLKDGATMVETVRDILANLSPLGELPLAEQLPLDFNEAPTATLDEQTIDRARAAVLESLSASPTLTDDILTITGLTPHLLMAVLLELELAGRLERHAGSKVALRMGEAA